MVNPAVARQQLDIRLERLRSMPYDELISLAATKIEEIPFGNEQWSLTTYRNTETDAVRIVVQIGPPQPKFVLLRVQADGFRMAVDGTLSPLVERELYEFK